MALDDIVFAEGDPQNFVVEIATATYSGTLSDAGSETASNSGLITVEVVRSPPTRAEVLYVG